LRTFLAWGGLCAVYVLLSANSLAIPLERDEGLFGYIGQTILDGGIPYRDVIDHKAPLTHYVYAVALMFVPPTATGVHGFFLVYGFATLVVVYRLARALTDSRAIGLWSALSFAVFTSLSAVQGFSASAEMLMLLPAALAIYCAILAKGPDRNRWALRSGVFAACAVLTKQSAVFFVPLMLAHIARVSRYEAGSARTLPRAMTAAGAAWSLGFLIPCAVVLAYFAWHHAVSYLFYWTVTYNLFYANTLSLARIVGSPYLAEIVWTAIPLILGVVVALVTQPAHLRAFLLGLLCCSFLAVLVGHGYRHYFAQLAIFVSLAAGVGLARLSDRASTQRVRAALGPLLAALVVVFPVAADRKYYLTASPEELSRRFFGMNPFPEAVDVARYIAARTLPSEGVFVLGSEPEILFYSMRRSPTRFALKYPLVGGRSTRQDRYQNGVMRVLDAAPPRYIVVIPVNASLTWDGREPESFPLRDRVKEMVRTRYALEAAMPIVTPKGHIIRGPFPDTFPNSPSSDGLPILIYRRLDEPEPPARTFHPLPAARAAHVKVPGAGKNAYGICRTRCVSNPVTASSCVCVRDGALT
jgi:hypothetical protein